MELLSPPKININISQACKLPQFSIGTVTHGCKSFQGGGILLENIEPCLTCLLQCLRLSRQVPGKAHRILPGLQEDYMKGLLRLEAIESSVGFATRIRTRCSVPRSSEVPW